MKDNIIIVGAVVWIMTTILLISLRGQPPLTINAPTGLTVYVDGHPVGTVTTLNFVNGNGIIVTCSTAPSNTANCNLGVDTNVILSRATDQAGTDNSWVSSSNSSTAYTAAATPILTQYTQNMNARWIPDVNCGSSPSLSIGGLGPITLKKVSSGTLINLAASDCRAGISYFLRSHGNPVDAFILSVEP